MVNANHCRRFWSPLGWSCLAFCTGSALAEQVCKYDRIAVTTPASGFIDNGDGTVTDRATGLQWNRCGEGQTWSGGTCTGSDGGYTWSQAPQNADTARFVGKDDWRLCNSMCSVPVLVHSDGVTNSGSRGVYLQTITGIRRTTRPA